MRKAILVMLGGILLTVSFAGCLAPEAQSTAAAADDGDGMNQTVSLETIEQ